MANVTIDGKAVEFSPGETVIQAATRKAIEIPYYCWHPRLSVAANCRMCLVEVEKAPKLVPACQTECKEGMVVFTTNAKVKAAQRAIHEFLLVNHPIDCPICDQAGECKLQDYYMKFQLSSSRMVDTKVHKRKLLRLGPHVVYNAERCIVCTRCVRFMEEVAKQRQLGVFNRGDHSVIGTYPDQPLDNPYSLNTVDVCPVGALTSTIFRFKQRVWNLRRSPSVCGGCAKGCNIHVDQRSAQVYRLLPRENEAVNKSWLCDEGRLTYNRANENRLEKALLRQGPAGPADAASGSVLASGPVAASGPAAAPLQSVVGGAQACAQAVQLLQPLLQRGAAIEVALSLHATCEEAYILGRFAKDTLGVSHIALLGHADGDSDKLLRVADKNPNRRGITQVFQDLGLMTLTQKDLLQRLEGGQAEGLLCVGHEAQALPELGAAAAQLKAFVHIAAATSALSDTAHVTLPGSSWVQAQGTWVNAEGRLQHLTPAYACQAEARTHSTWVQALAKGLGSSLDFGSVLAIQADMQQQLRSFAGVNLAQLPPTGQAAAAQGA
jgi:NADH-quinone oxidoreductase subunit G